MDPNKTKSFEIVEADRSYLDKLVDMTYRSFIEVENIDTNRERHNKGISFIYDQLDQGNGVLGRYFVVLDEEGTV